MVDFADWCLIEVTGERTPDELRGELAEAERRVEAALGRALPRVIDTPRGPTTVPDFLSTRVIEFVVHADDLSRSVQEHAPVQLDRAALAETTRSLVGFLAARLLSPAPFGEYSTAFAFVGLFRILPDFGMSYASTLAISRDRSLAERL